MVQALQRQLAQLDTSGKQASAAITEVLFAYVIVDIWEPPAAPRRAFTRSAQLKK